jgi:hypothetical protein
MNKYISKDIIIYHIIPFLDNASFFRIEKFSYNLISNFICQSYISQESYLENPNKYKNRIKKLKNIISIKKIPKFITHLWFENYVVKFLDYIPNTVTHLILPDYYDYFIFYITPTITTRTLIPFIKTLDKLPNSITHLILGNGYNLDKLPNSIKHLTLKNGFGLKLDKLPKHSTKGDRFYHRLDNLPNSLTHLNLEYNFNQNLNKLPKSLTHLTLTIESNLKFNDLLTYVTHSTLGNHFNKGLLELGNSNNSIILMKDY